MTFYTPNSPRFVTLSQALESVTKRGRALNSSKKGDEAAYRLQLYGSREHAF
eukprot:COSAG06_NODE_1148_length_10500_cov_47.939044_2_plen_52_part_00